VIRLLSLHRPLLVAAGILYILSLRAYYVGFFNDDAFFLIGAESLLSGSYSQLQAPGAPPLVQYLPGYSFLLAPVLLLSGGSWTACALVSALLLWTCAVVLPRAWGDSIPSEAALVAALLLAINPLSLSLAGTLLSDIPYTFVTLLILWRARAFWHSQEDRNWALLGAMAAYAFMLRPTGFAFILVAPAMLFYERRVRASAAFLAAALPLAALFPLRNTLVAGAALPYAAELADPYAASGTGPYLYHLWYYVSELFGRILLRWPFGKLALPWTLLAMAGGGALTLVGAMRWMSAPPLAQRGWRRFTLAYGAAYFLVLLGWNKTSSRYLLPLLPLVLPWLCYSLAQLGKERHRDLRLTLLLGLSLIMTAPAAMRIAQASWTGHSPMATVPPVYAWLTAHTPATAIIGADLDGRVFVRSRRRSVRPPAQASQTQLAQWLEQSAVDYILLRPEPFLMQARGGSGAHASRETPLAALTRGPGFERVYTDDSSVVYRRISQ
jgi:hypothetical protein